MDGHNHTALAEALGSTPWRPGKPQAVIAHTIKGKGVSYMENKVEWHYRSPSPELLAQALAEIGEQADA
jgi:transketolase